MAELKDTAVIREFMEAFGQETLDVPTKDVPEDVRLLRARLVLEEAFELAEALGVKVSLSDDEEPQRVAPKSVRVEIDESQEVDLVETADALADIIVVTKGGALAFGVPIDDILVDEVGPSNMAKMGPDGKPIRRESDGKVLKPEGWEPPNIRRALRKAGWDGVE